jgi:aminomethyltransferase
MSSADYQALRQGVGLIEQPDWRVVRFEGPDRLSFLHKYCTQDVKELPAGRGAYGCCLTVKGTMVSDFWLLARADDALCVVTPAGAAALPSYLAKFALFDQVELAVFEELTLLRLVGPAAGALLEQVTGLAAPEADLAHATLSWEGVVLFRDDLGALPGWGLLVESSRRDAVVAALEGAGALRVGLEAAEQARVEAGRPTFGVDMTEATIPIEAGIESRAISYEKGCYIGQEVVARIAHRGHVNRHLRGFRLPGEAPLVGPTPIFDDRKQVGTITSSVRSPLLGGAPVGLGIVHRKRAEPGSQVHLGASDGEVATVVALPFEEDR